MVPQASMALLDKPPCRDYMVICYQGFEHSMPTGAMLLFT